MKWFEKNLSLIVITTITIVLLIAYLVKTSGTGP